MMKSVLSALFLLLGAALVVEAIAGDNLEEDTAELLRLHEEVLEAHRAGDVDLFFSAQTDTVISGGRGEVRYISEAERRPGMTRYLESAEFEKYQDMIEPIVRVSGDGTLGWVICQIEIVGTRASDTGERVDIDSVWAWIELYEKIDGHWRRTGSVSSMKPKEE
jgi:hypothetical protein